MMTTLGGLLLAAGAVLLVIAAWGVIVLPDALARQHAATKAGTLALTEHLFQSGVPSQSVLETNSAASTA